MIAVSEAKRIISEHTEKTLIKTISLADATGFVLAQNVCSLSDVPAFDNSAMDGFALKLNPAFSGYTVTGMIEAGNKEKVVLREGEAVRILTGAPLPEEADTVIQQELVNISGSLLNFDSLSVSKGANIRKRAAQCCKGSVIANAGTIVTPGTVSLIASVGINEVPVYVPPSVGVITTGSELQEAGNPPQDFKIYNSNGPAINSYLKTLGVKVSNYLCVPDNYELLKKTIKLFFAQCDMLIISGGISEGDFDFVKSCLSELAVQQLFYKVKQKPGKPLYAGKQGARWVFALPGNPAAVLTCLNQYIKPCIRDMMGYPNPWECPLSLPIANDYHKKSELTHFLKGKIEKGAVTVCSGQESFNLLAFNGADCFIEIPEHESFCNAGTIVDVYMW